MSPMPPIEFYCESCKQVAPHLEIADTDSDECCCSSDEWRCTNCGVVVTITNHEPEEKRQ